MSKKKKSGYDILKEKVAKLEAENAQLQTTIERQSRMIRQLTADLKVAQGNLDAADLEHERQMKEMYKALGWFRRWLWDMRHAPVFSISDRWHN